MTVSASGTAKSIVGIYQGSKAVLKEGVTVKAEEGAVLAQAAIYACSNAILEMKEDVTVDGGGSVQGVRAINEASLP